jgi:hypothetical protein
LEATNFVVYLKRREKKLRRKREREGGRERERKRKKIEPLGWHSWCLEKEYEWVSVLIMPNRELRKKGNNGSVCWAIGKLRQKEKKRKRLWQKFHAYTQVLPNDEEGHC